MTFKEQRFFVNPGHGGNDSGAVRNGRVEKTDALKLGKSIGDKLVAYNAQAVEIQRNKDVRLAISKIVELAKANKTTIFTAVHRNDSGDGKTTGFGVLVSKKRYDKGDRESYALAKEIVKAVQAAIPGIPLWPSSSGGINIQEKNVAVLDGAKCSAVTIEAGFVGTSDDVWFDKQYTALVEGITKGIVKYAGGSVGIAPTPPAPPATEAHVLKRILKYKIVNMTGDDVAQLQRFLIGAHGSLYPEGVTGRFTKVTRDAVKRYQMAKGKHVLGTADGIVGKRTWESFGGVWKG